MSLDHGPAGLHPRAEHDRVVFDVRPLEATADVRFAAGLLAVGVGGVVIAATRNVGHGVLIATVLATGLLLRWRWQRAAGHHVAVTRDAVRVVRHDLRGELPSSRCSVPLADLERVSVERHLGGRDLLLSHRGGAVRVPAASDDDAEWLAVELSAAAAAARAHEADPGRVPDALRRLAGRARAAPGHEPQ